MKLTREWLARLTAKLAAPARKQLRDEQKLRSDRAALEAELAGLLAYHKELHNQMLREDLGRQEFNHAAEQFFLAHAGESARRIGELQELLATPEERAESARLGAKVQAMTLEEVTAYTDELLAKSAQAET